MPDIFLSYSRDDQPIARLFAAALQRAGFTVWWDQTLNAGEAYDEVTEKALLEARAVVVLWSKKSVVSRWVRAEATQAERNKSLVPAMIEPCTRPIMFELTQTADLAHWKGDDADAAWQGFLNSVRRFVSSDATGAQPVLASTPHSNSPRSIKPAWIAAAVAAVFIAGAAVWKLSDRSTAESLSDGSQAVAADASVAVLPFKDLSPAKDQEYLADGITEEILNSLTGVQDLKVTGRTSSFAFKGKDVDLRTIGETLGVSNILDGSVRKDGKQLRVTVQLNNAATGYRVWSKTYERPLNDVFKIQDDIALSVARALQVTLDVGESARIPGRTRNVEAFEALLAADALSYRLTPESTRLAIQQYLRAIAIDPAYAEAWAKLSSHYRTAGVAFLADEPQQVWIERSNAALDEAARLAPDAYYVQTALGDRSYDRNRWSDAARHYKLAAVAQQQQLRNRGALNADPTPGSFLFYVGKFKEHIAKGELNRANDPLDPSVSMFLGAAYANIGSFQAAFAEMDRGLELEGAQAPIRYNGVTAALATGDRPQIEKWLERYLSNGTILPTDIHAAMHPLLGKPAQALAELHRRTPAASSPEELVGIATWMAYFGDSAGALEVLRSDAFRNVYGGLLPITVWQAVMRDVRKLPGFRQLMRDIGLVDYWKEFGWADLCKPTGEDDFVCE